MRVIQAKMPFIPGIFCGISLRRWLSSRSQQSTNSQEPLYKHWKVLNSVFTLALSLCSWVSLIPPVSSPFTRKQQPCPTTHHLLLIPTYSLSSLSISLLILNEMLLGKSKLSEVEQSCQLPCSKYCTYLYYFTLLIASLHYRLLNNSSQLNHLKPHGPIWQP